jgi:hypothetical protein
MTRTASFTVTTRFGVMGPAGDIIADSTDLTDVAGKR